jgi:hypothetical protein
MNIKYIQLEALETTSKTYSIIWWYSPVNIEIYYVLDTNWVNLNNNSCINISVNSFPFF